MTGTAQPNVSVDIDIDIDKSNKVVGGGNSKLLKGATRPLSEITTADQKKYLNAWNQIPHALKIDAIVPGTQRYDELRICEGMYGRDGIIRAMQKVKDSPYLKRLGSIRFDSYINRNALQKLLEGSYDRDYQQETGTGGAGDGLEWSS